MNKQRTIYTSLVYQDSIYLDDDKFIDYSYATEYHLFRLRIWKITFTAYYVFYESK